MNSQKTYLLIGVQKKTFHNQDMTSLRLLNIFRGLTIRTVVNTMRSLKLHRILLPGCNGFNHGFDIQCTYHWEGAIGTLLQCYFIFIFASNSIPPSPVI